MSKFTIQDIFLKYGDEYIKEHNLSKEQWKVFNAVRNCGYEKFMAIIFVHVKNVVKNISVITHVEIDIVLCVKIMQEKNGLGTSLVTYLNLNISISVTTIPYD